MHEGEGRVMGLDVGRKTIGVAVSDPLMLTAQGVEVWRRRSIDEDLEYLARLAREYDVRVIVMGLPLRTDGALGPEAEYVREFAQRVRQRIAADVVLWDERFTTKEAERVLIGAGVSRKKRKGVVDMTAATLILDGYLARHRPS